MEQTCILIASVWEIWGTARGKDLSPPQQTVLTDNSEVFPNSHDTLSVKCTRASERKKRCTLLVVWRWLISLMVPPFLLDPRAYSHPAASMILLKHRLDQVTPLPAEFKGILSCSKSKPQSFQRSMGPYIFRSGDISFSSIVLPGLWLKHPSQTLALGPLHFLFLLPGTHFPRSLCIHPHFLQLCSDRELFPENPVYNCCHQWYCLSLFPDAISSEALFTFYVFLLAHLGFILLPT